MIRHIILTKDSEWSKQQVKDHPEQYRRVGVEELKEMFCSEDTAENEKLLRKIRDKIILLTLLSGYSVIIDKIYENSKDEAQIRNLVDRAANVKIERAER